MAVWQNLLSCPFILLGEVVKIIKYGWMNLRRPLYKKGNEIPDVDISEINENNIEKSF